MPEYLAPGVYVEETSFRAKSIEGVSTSATGFAGPTRKGPTTGTPELITNFGDFERIYGGLEDLSFEGADTDTVNYVAHAARAYFAEGGRRLYVARAYLSGAGSGHAAHTPEWLVGDGDSDTSARFVTRFPGTGGNGMLELIEKGTDAAKRTLEAAPVGSLARFDDGSVYYLKTADGWRDESDAPPAGYDDLEDTEAPAGGAQIVTFTVVAQDADGQLKLYEDLGFGAAHPRYVGNALAATPGRSRDRLENLYAAEIGADVTPFELRAGLFPAPGSCVLAFSDGNDGLEPDQAEYETALARLALVEDISIVAAPGSSALAAADGIRGALVSHAERRRAYRMAVLDARPGDLTTDSVRADRGKYDSAYAAFYYPWVTISNPLARPGDESRPHEITVPASGFLCGIYARSDSQHGVFKAPANETVRSALRFSTDVNFAEQEVLNPIGVNCLRSFEGRGNRVWGARTLSSDPEWKYVNVRRYFVYLEQSIDRGTQWSVFEANSPRLWAGVRETVSGFLYNEWRSGALLGGTTDEAYSVRCDRSTMTQNDLDNGRLICEIGVAVLKPAEFVIFRIGQKTADARG